MMLIRGVALIRGRRLFQCGYPKVLIRGRRLFEAGRLLEEIWRIFTQSHKIFLWNFFNFYFYVLSPLPYVMKVLDLFNLGRVSMDIP